MVRERDSDCLLKGMRMFSNLQQEVVIDPEEPILKDTEKREFKAETKKL